MCIAIFADMLLFVALRRGLLGRANELLKLIYFLVGLDQELAICVGLFHLILALVGLHGLHGRLTVLCAFDFLLDGAVDGALLRQLNTIEIRPRVKFAVCLT